MPKCPPSAPPDLGPIDCSVWARKNEKIDQYD